MISQNEKVYHSRLRSHENQVLDKLNRIFKNKYLIIGSDYGYGEGFIGKQLELFETFEKRYGDQIPTVKGDITPYWEDGALSTAAEEGKNRINSLRLQQLGTLYSMINPTLYDQQKFSDAWANIILFHEHTWGAYNSISEPDKPFVTEQWRIKKQYMLDADKQVNQIEKDVIKSVSDPASKKNSCIQFSFI